MGSALVGGLLEAQAFAGREITVVEVRPEARACTRPAVPRRSRSPPTPISAESAILAVKPADLAEACRALRSVGVGRVLSIVAGASLDRLEELLAPSTPVIRAMPNTPALIRSGVSAIAAGSAAAVTDLEWAETILGAVGQVVRLPEKLLDAVTGLSGSGPAYVFLVAEALIEAGRARRPRPGDGPHPRERHLARVVAAARRVRLERRAAPQRGHLSRGNDGGRPQNSRTAWRPPLRSSTPSRCGGTLEGARRELLALVEGSIVASRGASAGRSPEFPLSTPASLAYSRSGGEGWLH